MPTLYLTEDLALVRREGARLPAGADPRKKRQRRPRALPARGSVAHCSNRRSDLWAKSP